MLQNLLISARSFVFTDGGSQFHASTAAQNVITLAYNTSIWHVPKYIKLDESWGYLIQIDHFNTTISEEKYTRVMECDQVPKDKQEEDENCTTLHLQVSFFLWKETKNS